MKLSRTSRGDTCALNRMRALYGLSFHVWRGICCLLALCATPASVLGQTATAQSSIIVRVTDATGATADAAVVTLRAAADESLWTVVSDRTGTAHISGLRAGHYRMTVSRAGFVNVDRELILRESGQTTVEISLQVARLFDLVDVVGRLPRDGVDEFNGRARMDDVAGTALFAGKKSEVLVLSGKTANLAVGNTRQAFAKVPGTNIWENDGSGLQVGISNRGLDPNRSWEMNSRQNGYDITADIFGYPEAYFTPPLEAVERIEVVRGSSSLQYGAQFGGLVNYVLKKAPSNRQATFATEQTVGGNSLFNSHNRVGGRIGNLTYNGYYHHRQGDGWRQNAHFNNDTTFGSIEYAFTERLAVGFEFTGMQSLVQMAGGLTDDLFRQDARLSVRPGNWFALTWLLPSFKLDYTIDPSTRLNVTAYGLRGQRHSLFNAAAVALPDGDVNVDDPNKPRTLYNDRFSNEGLEVRLLRYFSVLGRPNTLAAGVRYYHGNTVRQHGIGAPGDEVQFDFLTPELDRNLHFGNTNVAGFAESALRITDRLTVTPGLRLDHLDSTGEGRPIVGSQRRSRSIPLFGVGVTSRASDATSVYANVSQAYRPTLFNDFWRPDPTIVVDHDLHDMTGHVTEFGWRGKYAEWLAFDVGGFYLKYRNRLGLLTRADPNAGTVSLWTNVSDSRNVGVESFVEADLLRIFRRDPAIGSLFIFSSLAAIDARYQDGHLKGNRVELAPDLIARSGVTYRRRAFSSSLQHSSVGSQFTDATNTVFTVDGVHGMIPAYRLWDATTSYDVGKHYVMRVGINNVADARYFTRRATSYPGPGLIPADGRSTHVSFGVNY